MSNRVLSFALLSGAITFAIFSLGSAQTPPAPQGPAPQAYRPGLGDLMTTTVRSPSTGRRAFGQCTESRTSPNCSLRP